MDNSLYRKIRTYLRDLIKGTQWEGKVYCVGGCCRDEVLGFDIKDVDLAVNTPNGGVKFAEWLHKRHLTVERPTYFNKFGTARLHLKFAPDDEIELVQTRREQYTDRNTRNPETAFGSVYEDCERRDFTVNSLYYDISSDRLLDLTGKAIPDIQERVLRTPLDPDMTFDDDPVRILRGVRFAARFGWPIVPEAYEAMKRNVARLTIVSPERMNSELQRMVAGNDPRAALEMLRDIGALPYILPEIAGAADSPSVAGGISLWEHMLRSVELIPAHDVELRLAALLHDAGMMLSCRKDASGRLSWPQHEQLSIRAVKSMTKRLHMLRPMSREIQFLVARHEDLRDAGHDGRNLNDRRLRRLQFLCATPERFDSLMQLLDADWQASGNAGKICPAVAAVSARSRKMVEKKTDMFGYRLPVTSEEVSRIKGLDPGPKLTSCMNHLLRMAFANPALTREECIRELAASSPDKEKVRPIIRSVEREYKVKVLMAVRSADSASSSSGNSISFIYVSRPEHYFSVIERPDTISIAGSDTINADASGYDLRRLLHMILDGDLTLYEQLKGGVILFETSKFMRHLKELVTKASSSADREAVASAMTAFLQRKSQ